VGVYRILYRIERNILTIIVLDIGHRREIYR
jgi:mRNA-degrading endonuclease RelE of RelBE toxin-antitoxin system